MISNRGELIRSMLSANHKVHALVPSYDLIPEIDELGIQWKAIALSRTGINPLRDLLNTLEIYKHVRDIRPDKIFSYTIKPVIYGVAAGHWARVPQLYAMITGLGYVFTGRTLKQRILFFITRQLYSYSLRRTTAVFFQNPDDLTLFRKLEIINKNVCPILVNGSGVDMERFGLAPLPKGPPIFLVIARLLNDKGLLEFVEAATQLKAIYPAARFQLLGPHDPTLPHALPIETVEAWRSNPVIEFLGHQKDVRPFISAANVYVLPSYREGTPRSVLEAMSMGRPIVTTDVPGCRETVIEGKNGFLVESHNAKSLAAAMQRFIQDPAIIPVMGKQSRIIAEQKYDVNKVNQVIMQTMELL
ncbi:glycosyltransferase family 4 protein [Pusillimonas sp. ANT_WB101]|nr:glycosyltransferase family 4 protein [Pusillimonas sp. ANT_WB101]